MNFTQKMIGYGSAALSVLWGVYSSVMESDASVTGVAANIAKAAAVVAVPAVGAALLTAYKNTTADTQEENSVEAYKNTTADIQEENSLEDSPVAVRRSTRATRGKAPQRLGFK